MRQEEIWDVETARAYDTPGIGMFAPEVLEPTVDRLVELAGGGRVLEFAIGTGRVAVPLAGRGVSVTGIELSEPMIAELRTKADESAIPVIAGDMATTRAPGEFSLVYLVFNTISNLLTQGQQVDCFRNAARHLPPGGRFVIELGVPGSTAAAAGATGGYLHRRTRVHRAGHLRRRDAASALAPFPLLVAGRQRSRRHREQRRARLSRSPHRYIWPAELDLMAQLAGFELEARHADWAGYGVLRGVAAHVSVYRLPA